MNEAYQNLSELMDKWLSDSSKEIKMARIEKDILLEKMRNLYVLISNMETEEYAAPREEPPRQLNNTRLLKRWKRILNCSWTPNMKATIM